MINLNKIIPAAAALLLTLSSCTDIEDHSSWGYDVEPSMTAYIKGGAEQTQAIHFPEEAQAGVFLRKAGQPIGNAPAYNREYNIEPNGQMTAAKVNEAILFPADGAKRDIVAYYPYQAQLQGETLSLSLKNQQHPEALDMLYANDAKDKMGLDKDIRLGFRHSLTQLLVPISSIEGASTEGVKVSVVDVDTLATFHLNDGTVTPVKGKGEIALRQPEMSERAEAILAPMPKGNLSLKVTQKGEEQIVTVKGVTLKAGEIVVVPIKIVGADEDFEVVAAAPYSGAWTSYPGEMVNTPEKPNQLQPTESTQVLLQPIGTTLAQKVNNFWPRVSAFTGWTTDSLKITDVHNNLSVRVFSNTNCIWFAKGKENTLEISGFNTLGYKKLTLTYQLNANLYNEGDQMDLAAMKGTFNSVPFETPSQVVSNPTHKNTFTEVTIDLSVADASAKSVLRFTTGAENIMGLRLANIKIVGTK